MTYEEVSREVKIIEDDFNQKLVAILNSCDQPIILGMQPRYIDIEGWDWVRNPVYLFVKKVSDIKHPLAEYKYGKSTPYPATSDM